MRGGAGGGAHGKWLYISYTYNYGSELAPETETQFREDITNFLNLLQEEGVVWREHMDDEQFGHDFWLTRNGHGAGFWDRGLGELGQVLTKWAKTFGDCDLYVGDDNLVHIF